MSNDLGNRYSDNSFSNEAAKTITTSVLCERRMLPKLVKDFVVNWSLVRDDSETNRTYMGN